MFNFMVKLIIIQDKKRERVRFIIFLSGYRIKSCNQRMLRLSATYWTKYHAKQLVLYRTAPVLMILLLDNKIIEKQKQRIISLEQVFKT